MSTKQLELRVEQLETARPAAADEDLEITPGMCPHEALRRFRRSLDAPSRKPTPEEQAEIDRHGREYAADPELATRVYRLSWDHVGLTGDQLFELAKQQLADERAAQAAAPVPVAEQPVVEPAAEQPAADPEQPDPMAWLDEVDAWQDAHPGELYADRNGPPTPDEYRDPPQPEPVDEPAPVVDQQPTEEIAPDEPKPEPTPTPQAVQLAGQPDEDDSWMLL